MYRMLSCLMTLMLVATYYAIALDHVMPKDEKAVAAVAARSIPYVKEFLELYPDATVKMGYPISVLYTSGTEKDVRETFYIFSKVGLYKRYVLQMCIRFKMSPDQKTVTSFEKPDFRMQEVALITVTPITNYPDGQAHIMFTGFLSTFDYAKFKILKAHKGNFSVIGVDVNKYAPVENFEREWKPEKQRLFQVWLNNTVRIEKTNELLKLFISALLFCCVGGGLVGYVLARSSKRFDNRISVIATISGLCILLIFAAWALCLAGKNTGFILHVCNLLIIPFSYIVIFAGGHIYSFVLGAVIQIGLMTLTGWLTWHWVKARVRLDDSPG